MKRHECCKTCGYLALDFVVGNDGEIVAGNYYCEINNEKIEYPRKMGGRNKCSCYITKAEYRKESKRKTIENHVYPQKSETKVF
jgi:hypothetical protein